MIQVEHLTKRYGERVAVDAITFHANKGEIVGFLGPNGAGKTTTMRILTGFMPPTSGVGRVAGFDLLTQNMEVRRRVGYLPENVPLYPEMSVVGYLDFMAELRRLPNREDRVDEVMEQVHIVGRARSFISNLSKGLRQRVGLAQALLHQPDVLILDEPLDGLDPQQQMDVKNLLRQIGRERTVMLSTHNLADAQELCNRVIIINQGRIVAEDTPERLAQQIAGGGRVTVHVAGDGTGLKETLAQLPGLTWVNVLADGLAEVETEPGHDLRPALARHLIQHGFDLLEMRRAQASLADVFIELTKNQPTGAGEKEA